LPEWLSGVRYLDNPELAISLKQDPETEISPDEAFQELSLVLLPRTKALWESWIESGQLTVEDRECGRYWKVNAPPPQAGREQQAESM
jgi:hypothetical protein